VKYIRNQGVYTPYPKEITVVVTVEGKCVAKVHSMGFFGGKMAITEEVWNEIGRIMCWK
jgi:hypothetical protein